MIIFTVELEELRVVVDRSRNDGGMGGMWRERGEKEKECRFLTQQMWQNLTSQDV